MQKHMMKGKRELQGEVEFDDLLESGVDINELTQAGGLTDNSVKSSNNVVALNGNASPQDTT